MEINQLTVRLSNSPFFLFIYFALNFCKQAKQERILFLKRNDRRKKGEYVERERYIYRKDWLVKKKKKNGRNPRRTF